MKKIFSSVLILFLVYSNQVLSQSSPPDLISYQGIARDASGNILPNHLINVKFNIHQGSPNGPVVFSEPHSITTNSLGLFSLQIGSVNQNLNSVLWSNGPYYLEVLIDPNGGNSYVSIGTQEIISVPYALYSKNSYSSAISYISYTTVNGSSINFTSTGVANVTPTSGNSFTIDVPPPYLHVTLGTNDASLQITQGSHITTHQLPFPNWNITNFPNSNGDAILSINSGTFTSQTTLSLSSYWSKYGNQATNTDYLGTNNMADLVFKTNNLERMRISSNGNIGMGTSTPSSLLDILSTNSLGFDINITNFTSAGASIRLSAQNRSWVIFASNPSASAGNKKLVFRDYSMAIDRMVIDDSGRVGIGTLNPTNRLSVVGNIDIPPSNSYRYTSPKTYTLTIHPSSFHPESPAVACSFDLHGFLSPSPVGTLTLTNGYSCPYQAPLFLPTNATITALYAHVVDNDPTYNISQIQICKNDFQVGTSNGNLVTIGSFLSSSGSMTTIQQLSTTLFEIVNANNAYFIRVQLPYPGPSLSTIKLGKIYLIYQVLETD